ncbi:CRIB domain [Macleaya cordata]|uniref:CRIB domain n=1 Tax=Macleaya cordata TaxID=56857 RepID=A0A200Q2R2_MACCD|nr:CRIB domain [Macleaya cordata]
MTQLFRSKTCGLGRSTDFDSSPPSPSLYHHHNHEKDEEERENDDDDEDEDGDGYDMSPISTPLIVPDSRERKSNERQQNQQFQILTIFVEALRKSVATCGVEKDDICSLDISPPTDVRHVSHVTFDRFNGFLGLPVEFKPKVPTRVPSASSSVFGVSAESMKCSYDQRGNSVPTILLMMQRRLYLEGGLQTEGIFRINAENSQEEYVRDQLNRGIVKQGIDVHCLAGLIKAWFRELPAGVLDSLTPDQVMHCNTEEECMQLMILLQPTEAALLDWAINLMADVVQHENHNKMNARNIAMVFAPNMTQMADPLTALIHAVQVMNFLRTLIIKTIREREESGAASGVIPSCSESTNNINDPNPSLLDSETCERSCEHQVNDCVHDRPASGNLLNFLTRDRLESDIEQNSWNLQKSVDDEGQNSTPLKCEMGASENECRDGYNRDAEGFLDKLSLRKGVRKLRKHPVFQLSKSVKKSAEDVDI